MKIVINGCYGGFSLSPLAIARMAELQDRPCFFFTNDLKTGVYSPVSDPTNAEWSLFAFDILNPNEVLVGGKDWTRLTTEQRIAANELEAQHTIESRPEKRDDPILVRVVEELGERANGRFAELRVVEIPDGVAWGIYEYDGIETIHEEHRSWS